MHNIQLPSETEASELFSLHDTLLTFSSDGIATFVAVDLNRTETGSFGFMLGLDTNQRPIVKHVEHGVPLKRGDRYGQTLISMLLNSDKNYCSYLWRFWVLF